LDWKGGDEFRAATAHDWNNGSGLATSAEGLTFLQVYDAGHMVPSDKPDVALEMLKVFLSGGTF
jgi:cathepsin A (carboxypeptidase C)